MYEIIIGNICSLCAMITDSISGTRTKPSQILGIQIVSQFFYALGSIVLKGYSAVAQNIVAVLRNFAAIKEVKSRALGWGLVLLGVVLGILFNNLGLVGWLPIVANFQYSVDVFELKGKEKALKISFILNMLMFAVFCYMIRNYVGVVGNLVVATTTAASLVKERDEDEALE